MVEAFLRYIRGEKNYSSNTVMSYKNDLAQFQDYCEREAGGFDPLLVDAAIVRAWMTALVESGEAVSTVRRKVCALRSFFRYLKREGKIAGNPLTLVAMPRAEKKLPVYVREGQMECLIDDIPFGDDFDGVRDRLMLVMLYTTGMRRSELVGVADADVDFHGMTIRVTGKGNKQRLIPFGRELADMMQAYLACRSREVGKVDGSAFLVRQSGEALYVGMVYRKVKHYLALVTSISKKSPHVLRHTFATAMLADGADLTAVKELLGHSSLSSTEVYTHVSPREILLNYNRAHPRALKKGGQDGN